MDVATEPHAETWLVPGRGAAVVANGARIGALGQLAPAIAETHGLPAATPSTSRRSISTRWTRPRGARDVRVEPLPRYPSVTRDISILVDDTLPAADVRAHDPRAPRPTRSSACVNSIATRARAFPTDKVSLSLRLTFRSSDRTLTDAEVQAAMDAVLAALQERATTRDCSDRIDSCYHLATHG